MGHRCCASDIHGPPLRLPGPAEQHRWPIVAVAARDWRPGARYARSRAAPGKAGRDFEDVAFGRGRLRGRAAGGYKRRGQAGHSDFYNVAASDSVGVSPDSNEVSATPAASATPPAAPTGLAATAGNGLVGLTWKASTGATSYSIYRGTTSGAEGTTPVGTATSPSFSDTGLTNGTAYYYKVTASNSAGTSGNSNEATATPISGSGGVLLSQGQPATASSVQNSGYPASNAVDGSLSTRWSSAFSDPQWLEIDLGATHTISKVVLDWENAYATAFQIQRSPDGATWTTIYSTSTSTGGTQTLNVTGTGRYVRMYGTQRATGYGYSLWEFEVFGS